MTWPDLKAYSEITIDQAKEEGRVGRGKMIL